MVSLKAVLAAGTTSVALVTASAAAALQGEPDRLLRLNSGFGDANYYFYSGQSKAADHGVQVLTEVVDSDARVTMYQMIGAMDDAADPLPGRPWREVRCHDSGAGFSTFRTRAEAESYRQQWIAATRAEGLFTIVEIAWPGKPGWSSKASKSAKATPAPKAAGGSDDGGSVKPAPSRYVEVNGPDGPIRLSPEVAARNEAAAAEHRRQTEEHAKALAAHEQKLALHRDSMAKATAERQEHERKMVENRAQVASVEAAQLEYRKQLAKPAGVTAVYRGFSGPTCEMARASALRGSGTDSGTQFKEVTQDLSGMPKTCVVQGWHWTTSRTGSSRQ